MSFISFLNSPAGNITLGFTAGAALTMTADKFAFDGLDRAGKDRPGFDFAGNLAPQSLLVDAGTVALFSGIGFALPGKGVSRATGGANGAVAGASFVLGAIAGDALAHAFS